MTIPTTKPVIIELKRIVRVAYPKPRDCTAATNNAINNAYTTVNSMIFLS